MPHTKSSRLESISMLDGSPPPKRAKTEQQASGDDATKDLSPNSMDDGNHCSICLQHLVDRTVIPTCSHEFCFECLLLWSEQSRRCPLCSQSIGDHVIHSIRSRYDYRKHYLTPLRTSPAPTQPRETTSEVRIRQRRRTAREREWGRRAREEREEADKLDRAIARRRWIYEHDLYAKHVASNSHTKYRPYPTPAQFAASADLISRTTSFLRRELRIWDNLDVEFLTTFIISLMKAIDIRSESSVKLLAEFLDMDVPYVQGDRHVNAEHFAHEVYSYVRSPYRDLFVYDTVAQYDSLSGVSAPDERQCRRWRESYQSPSPQSEGRQRASRSRSLSWSPSGRRYSSERARKEQMEASTSAVRARDRDYHETRRIRGRRSHSSDGKADLSTTRADQAKHHQDHAPRFPRDPSPDGSRMLRAAIASTSNSEVELGHALVRGSLPRSPAVDVKGKRKVAEPESDETPPTVDSTRVQVTKTIATSQITTELDGLLSTPASSAQPNLSTAGQRRPPRNRSLLESVQVHLTLGSKSHASGYGSEKRDARHPTSSALSDSSVTAPPSKMSREPGIQPASPVMQPAPEGSDGDNSKDKTKMSAPEIMARTRARLAKSMGRIASSLPTRGPSPTWSPSLSSSHQDTPLAPDPEMAAHGPLQAQPLRGGATVKGSPPNAEPSDSDIAPGDRKNQSPVPYVSIVQTRSSLPQGEANNKEVSSVHHPPSSSTNVSGQRGSPEIPFHVPSRPGPSTRASPIQRGSPTELTSIHQSHPAASDPRERLLIRLEKERNQVRSHQAASPTLAFPALSGLDRTFPSTDNIYPTVVTDVSVDSQAMEAKLRTRAQLRVRLAAEKRSGGDAT